MGENGIFEVFFEVAIAQIQKIQNVRIFENQIRRNLLNLAEFEGQKSLRGQERTDLSCVMNQCDGARGKRFQ